MHIQDLNDKLVVLKATISRHSDAYLENGLELSEYQERKNQLVGQKADLQGKLSAFQQTGNNWLELTRNWILTANTAVNLASGENFPEMKGFLKKNRLEPKNPKPFSFPFP